MQLSNRFLTTADRNTIIQNALKVVEVHSNLSAQMNTTTYINKSVNNPSDKRQSRWLEFTTTFASHQKNEPNVLETPPKKVEPCSQ